MPYYKITTKGGGPTLQSNPRGDVLIKASSPHVALSRAVSQWELEGYKLPKAAWTHITIVRTD